MSEWRPGIAVTAQRHSGSIRGSPDEVMRGNASQYLHNFRSGALIDILPRARFQTVHSAHSTHRQQFHVPVQASSPAPGPPVGRIPWATVWW